MDKITIAEVILENLTVIEIIAFSQCSKLKSISICSSFKTIGFTAFLRCSNLEIVSFDEKSNLIEIDVSSIAQN